MTRCLTLNTLMITALLLAVPALADKAQAKAPEQAIGKDTMMLIYVDVQQIKPEVLAGISNMLIGLADNPMFKQEDIALPLGDPQQFVDSLTTLRGSFIEAGGQGLLMTMDMPGEESWSPPMSLLAKTNDKYNAQSMGALVRTIGQDEMDATLEPVVAGWQNIAIKSKEGEAVTLALPQPDAAAFTAFDKQLGQSKDPVFAMVFRMQDQMRERMDEAENLAKNAQPGPDQDAQAQMAMGLMMGMFKPIRSLDTLGLAVSQVGEGMQVDMQLSFLDQQSAQMFSNLYNSIMMFAPVMMAQAGQAGQGGQGGQIANMPDPATINSFFMKLKMQLAGDTLKLTLDQEFFDLAVKMAPLFEGVQADGAPEPEL